MKTKKTKALILSAGVVVGVIIAGAIGYFGYWLALQVWHWPNFWRRGQEPKANSQRPHWHYS